MGRIGDLPSVPDEFIGEVVSTSWSLANTSRDPTIVLRAEPGHLATQCPSCRSRLIVDVIGSADVGEVARWRKAFESPVSTVLRHATQVAEQTPLAVAAELLAMSPRRMAVVVDVEHRPLGVLTSTHVLSAVKRRSKEQLATVSALDAASSSGPMLAARTRLDVAARILAAEDRDFVLVVDEAGVLLGVLLATDVLTVL